MNSTVDRKVRRKHWSQVVLPLSCLLLVGSLSGCGSLFQPDDKLPILEKMKQGNYNDVVSLCSKELKTHPSDPDYYAYKGVAENRLGNFDLALADLRKAIELEPKSGWYYREVGETYLSAAKYRDAEEPFLKAKELLPKSDNSMPSLLSSLAIVYLRINEPQKSRDTATEALELSPKQKYTLVTRALAYLDLFEMEKGLADVNKALALDDKNPGAYATRSSIYLQLGELKKCKDDAEKALQIDEKFWEATELLISLNLINGASDAALALADQLIRDRPESSIGYADKANCLFALGKFDDARKLSDKSLTLVPSGGRALSNAILLAGVAHDRTRVDNLTDQLKAIGSGERRAERMRGMAYLFLKDYKGAADIFSSLIVDGRKTPNDYRLRSKAYELMHQNALAEKDMERALAAGYSKLSVLEQEMKLLK